MEDPETPNLTSPSGWTYVQTQTTYNDTSGWYGMPQTVTEDYGSGKINRVTTTNAYDAAGRATSVTDAANRTFVTDYDDDGRVVSVTRTDTNPDAILVTYTYDTGGGVNNGMVKTIVDKSSYVITPPGGVPTITHSDVTQSFTYHASGVGIGQVSQIEEERTGTEYTTAYEYNGFGERTKATYTTPNGTSRWHYEHYQTVGDPLQGKRAFQRVTKLDGSSNPTSEEFHYYYDSQGRLLYSAFAQDPDDWSPSSGYSYYDSSHHADYRCLATYAYDAAGRLGSLDYTWQTWVPSGETGSYSTTGYIGKTAYEYELSGLNRGLRTQLEVYGPNGGNTAFQLNRVEDYAYDADLDYLTSAQYNDNASGGYEQEDSWTYDAAGNRISETRGATTKSNFTYDNLNRMTESPITSGTSYGYYKNILGNRLERDDFTMSTWATYAYDDLNRMTKMVNYGTGGMKNTYRADGMRVEKVTGCSTTYEYDPINDSYYWDENWSVNKPTKRFYYDGQMCMEEDYAADTLNDPVYDMTYYGLGARGIDFIETWVWDPGEFDHVITKKFPLYDGHGNMLATLQRSGSSPYYTVTDAKSYDVWGSVRSGSGGPFQRYCANLGHVQDDESGLIYMRARFYEPWTGRFLTEDPGAHGWNWFTYCGNDPANRSDHSGKLSQDEWMQLMLIYGFTALMVAAALATVGDPETKTAAVISVGIAVGLLGAAAGFSDRLARAGFDSQAMITSALGAVAIPILLGIAQGMSEGAKKGFVGLMAVTAAAAYSCLVLFLLVDLHLDEL